MSLPINCHCGRLKGAVDDKAAVNRCVCYCSDCQAFARYLGRENDLLDERGGSRVLQTAPDNITFTESVANLACMRLTPKGLLRWYAECCNTPIGNTPPNYRMSFVGMVETCLGRSGRSLDEAFGPVRAHVHTAHARGEPKPKTSGMAGAIVRVVSEILKARLSGRYKRTPFFSPESGEPIVEPIVLTPEELIALKNPQ